MHGSSVTDSFSNDPMGRITQDGTGSQYCLLGLRIRLSEGQASWEVR